MKRDKFLTEAMGECWHDYKASSFPFYECCKCFKVDCCAEVQDINFATWEGFGKLWEWSQEQEWWGSFGDSVYDDTYESDPKYKMPICELEYFINPDRFANAVYGFLKERT